MKLIYDSDNETITVSENGSEKTYALDSAEGFSALSKAWLRAGWDTKYVYSFTWLGRPIIQLPEDMIRIQEVIYQVKPDVIVETGIAHGGSLVFFAGLCKAMDHGRVIGVDIEIRPHNREAVENHELFEYITMIEGNSIQPEIVRSVKKCIKPGEKCLVILDSNHSKDHVQAELNLYSEMVTVDSYIVACDGIMEDLPGAPRSESDWEWNNPKSAAEEFVKSNEHFIIEEPEFPFNEGAVNQRVTYWPSAFVKRVKE